MKYALAFILLISAPALHAQQEKSAYKAVRALFEKSYNSQDPDAVFALFSSDMQKALPLEKTKDFISNLNEQAGLIKSMEFTRYENGTYASYKTQFDRALLAVNISIDGDSKINGLFVKQFVDHTSTQLKRNITPMQLPFNEEWTVVWGGDTREQNYHVDHVAQKNAFDLVITDKSGRSYKGSGEKNEDYYAFGKELLAPCEGVVVLVVDGIHDNKPGQMNPVYVPGNTVVIKTKNNEYLFFAHFKKHSIKVKEGEKVKKGQLLGLCGNSGNSSEAHLHFHIQNSDDMNTAIGAKAFFEKILVNGEVKTDYSPVKGERIRN